MMKKANKNIYLKIILTIIAILLAMNILINTGIFDNKAFAVTQTMEFQDQFKFLLGPQSNIRGNLMVLEYPGKGIYYINLDNVESFFESKNYIEFTADRKKFKLQKPELDTKTEEEKDSDSKEEESPDTEEENGEDSDKDTEDTEEAEEQEENENSENIDDTNETENENNTDEEGNTTEEDNEED